MDMHALSSDELQTDPEGLEGVFEAMATYFSLLADPTRLRIMHSICDTERHVSAIVGATGVTQTSVSRHLGLLHRAGAVSRRKVRRSVHYQVVDRVLADICRTVCVQMAGRTDAGMPRRDRLRESAERR